MAPKRKNDEESTARERKKQKMAVARTIEVQSTTPRSAPENAIAGPSRTVTFVDSECLVYLNGTQSKA
jgi:ribonuclease P/MRP protein subunit POP1